MGITDFIVFPFYLFLFYFIFYLQRKNLKDPVLKKYHKYGFWVKLLGTICFTIFSVYISPGDSKILYHTEGLNIYHLILQDGRNVKWLFTEGKNFDESLLKNIYNSGYFKSESNYLVTKLVALLSFITLGKYLVINMMFSFIAFTGIWKLFLFFYEQYPQHHKKLAIAILYLPTFVFWSSGILKDTLCIAAIGWITYALYGIFWNKKSFIKNVILLLFFSYILATIKVYILISYIPFFILFIILKNMQVIQNKMIKYMIAPLLILVFVFGFGKVLKSFDDELGKYAFKDVTASIKNLNEAFEGQTGIGAESNFSLGAEFDGSVSGLVKIAPIAIATTLFRPFLWESHKLSSLLASLEGLLLMMFTLYVICKAGIISFIKIILNDPLIIYCFLFAFVFAWFVGASTLNFGTLVRYKIPCMPFYLISLFLIYEKVKVRAKAHAVLETVTQRPVPLQLSSQTC